MRAKVFATLFGALLLMVPSATHSTDKSYLDCLTLGMYHEARGETSAGIKAVGHVIINRTKAKGFPSNVCAVLYDKGSFTGIKKSRVYDKVTYNKIYKLAETVYANPKSDNTLGATYFHEVSVRPSWSRTMKFTVQIGSHKFYKGRV